MEKARKGYNLKLKKLSFKRSKINIKKISKKFQKIFNKNLKKNFLNQKANFFILFLLYFELITNTYNII